MKNMLRWAGVLFSAGVALALLLALFFCPLGFSQTVTVRGTPKGATPSSVVTATSVDADHTALDVRVANVPAIAGTVSVSNFPATQPVSGTFWQATQPVSGTFWQATQPVSGTFFQATQPVASIPSTDTTNGGLLSSGKATLTTSVNVKASAGLVYGIYFMNGAGAGCWLELINSNGAGTLGTAVLHNIPLTTSGTQFLQFLPPLGGFTTGIAVGAASAIGGASACGTAVTGVTVVYK